DAVAGRLNIGRPGRQRAAVPARAGEEVVIVRVAARAGVVRRDVDRVDVQVHRVVELNGLPAGRGALALDRDAGAEQVAVGVPQVNGVPTGDRHAAVELDGRHGAGHADGEFHAQLNWAAVVGDRDGRHKGRIAG